ncbi:MAG: ABC transporter ATP-binding protein [FCB group bacterium]|nr:ABC transporter ATP-binding protein [FCB group bacterium]
MVSQNQFDQSIPAVETVNLRKNYGDFQALKGITLSIPQGSFFGLLGPNGAGKTTTIGILTGLVLISSGEAKILGHDVVRDFRITRKAVGLSPQELNFDPFFTIVDLLSLQAGYYGLNRRESRKRALEMLDLLGLSGKAKSKMRELSGGMKRRVQIAKALVHDPPIVILDEPTAGVDIELRHMLWRYLTEINKSGKTILLTTHYIEEAENLCDNVAIIDDGRVIIEGSPDALKQKSGNGMIKLRLINWDRSKMLKDWTYTFHENEISIQSAHPEKDLPAVIAEVTRQGGLIEEARLCNNSLEDVFIQLTGKTIDD